MASACAIRPYTSADRLGKYAILADLLSDSRGYLVEPKRLSRFDGSNLTQTRRDACPPVVNDLLETSDGEYWWRQRRRRVPVRLSGPSLKARSPGVVVAATRQGALSAARCQRLSLEPSSTCYTGPHTEYGWAPIEGCFDRRDARVRLSTSREDGRRHFGPWQESRGQRRPLWVGMATGSCGSIPISCRFVKGGGTR